MNGITLTQPPAPLTEGVDAVFRTVASGLPRSAGSAERTKPKGGPASSGRLRRRAVPGSCSAGVGMPRAGVTTQQRVDQDVDIDVAATVAERSSCGALDVTPHFSAIRPEAAFSGTMTS
jgi:hypothetical protein